MHGVPYDRWHGGLVTRWGILAFGIVAYLAGVLSLVAFALSSSGLLGSRSVDAGPASAWPAALAIDAALLFAFALLHSVMARRSFKRVLARWVAAPAERSVYVFVAAGTLALLTWQWRPIAFEVWNVDLPAARHAVWCAWAGGWLLAGFSMVSMDHLELLGLRQALAHFRGDAHDADGLVTTGVYRYLRDPMYLGFLVAIWSAPRMTAGHLVLAAGMSVYLVVGMAFERRDLRARSGDRYLAYVSGREP